MSGAGFLIIIVAFAFLWLVIVRPQKRRQVAQQKLLSDLRVGDEVLTAGGIYGRVTGLEDDVATVELAPEVAVRVSRRAIASILRDEPEAEAYEADEFEAKTAEEPREAGDPPADGNPG